MAVLETWASPASAKASADRLVSFHLGAMSTLWITFASFAAAGAAMWTFSGWMRLATPEGAAEVEHQFDIVEARADALAEAAATRLGDAVDILAETVPTVAPRAPRARKSAPEAAALN